MNVMSLEKASFSQSTVVVGLGVGAWPSGGLCVTLIADFCTWLVSQQGQGPEAPLAACARPCVLTVHLG